MQTLAAAVVKTDTSRFITVGNGVQVRFGNGTIRTFTITSHPQSAAATHILSNAV